jgi:hypothetical protein
VLHNHYRYSIRLLPAAAFFCCLCSVVVVHIIGPRKDVLQQALHTTPYCCCLLLMPITVQQLVVVVHAVRARKHVHLFEHVLQHLARLVRVDDPDARAGVSTE